MYCSTTANKAFTDRVREWRPLSHLAAATLLCTSIAAVHYGMAIALTSVPGLAVVATAAIIGMEWVQWTSLGRIAKLEDAGQFNRAGVLKLQSAGIGILQVILYTIAVLGFATAAGANWATGWPLFGAIVIATLYAALNFVMKWTSCEHVEAAPKAATGPTGGTRAPLDEAIFGAPKAEAKPATITELKRRIGRHAEARPFRPATTTASTRQPKPAAGSTIGKLMADLRWEQERQRRTAG